MALPWPLTSSVGATGRRSDLSSALGQLDAALDHTRAQRVHDLAGQPTPHLFARLGPVPSSPAGRAVWCHHALRIEAALDRNSGGSPPSGRGGQPQQVRLEIAIADRLFQDAPGVPGPDEWARLASEAVAVRQALQRKALAWSVAQARATVGLRREVGTDNALAPHGSELGL
ncbi:MAG TPA: hypothetical protein VMF65_09185 [Acidimicrobiales bacterium]|nr:hypothetical protein [Acidimicrobiales bacterium]